MLTEKLQQFPQAAYNQPVSIIFQFLRKLFYGYHESLRKAIKK